MRVFFYNIFQYANAIFTHLITVLLSSYRFWVHAYQIYASPGMHSQLLRLLVGYQRLKPLLKFLNGHLLTIPMLHATVDSLGWDEYIAYDVNDAIGCNSIFDRNSGEAVNFDLDKSSISSNVDTKRLVFQKCLKVDLNILCKPKFGWLLQGGDGAYMEVTLGNIALFHDIINRFSLVVSIGVQCLIGDDVVLQESLEVFLTVFAEKEGIDPRTQLLEGEVRRGENSSPKVGRSVCNGGQEIGLCKAELQGTELPREKLNDAGHLWWRDDKAVNAMDNTVGSKLSVVSINLTSCNGGRTISMATMRL